VWPYPKWPNLDEFKYCARPKNWQSCSIASRHDNYVDALAKELFPSPKDDLKRKAYGARVFGGLLQLDLGSEVAGGFVYAKVMPMPFEEWWAYHLDSEKGMKAAKAVKSREDASEHVESRCQTMLRTGELSWTPGDDHD
jgi:hypothetical protein